MEFTALEMWIIRTAIAQSQPQGVADMMARGKLLDMMEFSDGEKGMIGWRVLTTENGSEVPQFEPAAIIARALTEKQTQRLRAILCEMAPLFRVQVHAHLRSALVKLGWAPMEDE